MAAPGDAASVTFDGSSKSCSAHVISGKAGGAAFTSVTSMVTGGEVDMYSIKTSGESFVPGWVEGLGEQGEKLPAPG